MKRLYKSAVSIVKKEQLCRMFQFLSVNVFAHLSPDISIKSAKLHFQNWKKNSQRISLFFLNMTADVSRNNYASSMRIENTLDIF